MFHRIRTSPAIRAALCVAALLALAGSFGLHPEPIGSEALAAHRGLARVHVDDAPHACLACLSHVAASVQPFSVALPVGQPSAPLHRIAGPPADGRVAGLDLPGRSPPARS
jgi:hypothetical protein